MSETRGYNATKDDLLRRLARVEGQERRREERVDELMGAVGRMLSR